nr:HEPN domain-containing protein [Methanoculleus sp. CWC-02]
MREAGEDLVAAERTLAEGNAKWAIIQGYYAQFHALRALVFSRGYREKSHSCLRYAVEALYVDEGLLPASVLEDFSFAMRTREGADYGCVYSGSDAGDVVASAGAIVDRVRTMLG